MEIKKYIYLDWNVVQYMKKPREKYEFKDTTFKELVFQNKNKYDFPYCEAHLKDLASGYKEEHKIVVYEDLDYLSKVSSNKVIGINNNDQFMIVEKNPEKFFEEIINKENDLNLTIDHKSEKTISIDMSKLDKDNPLFDMLTETGGKYSQLQLESWLLENFDNYYNDPKIYKKYRNYVPKILDAIHNNKKLDENELDFFGCCFSYLDLCKNVTNLDVLKLALVDSLKSWLLFRYKDPSKIPFGDLIATGYTLLDFHPLFHDKLKKNNKLNNIVRDSKHAFFAHKAKYFVTEDKESLKKIDFLYECLNIKTKAIDMDNFIKKFS